MMRRYIFYALAIGIIIADQLVKAWVRGRLGVGGEIVVIPHVFYLMHTQNRGMAFSLLENTPYAIILLAAAALIVAGAIVVAQWRMGKQMPWRMGLALALPLGGAIGNLIDRLSLGYVTDLFDFRLINFPVFNVADSAITVGIALLAVETLFTKQDVKPDMPGEYLMKEETTHDTAAGSPTA